MWYVFVKLRVWGIAAVSEVVIQFLESTFVDSVRSFVFDHFQNQTKSA